MFRKIFRKTSKQDVSKQDVSKQDVSEQDVSEHDMSEQDVSEQDVSKQEMLEKKAYRQEMCQQKMSQESEKSISCNYNEQYMKLECIGCKKNFGSQLYRELCGECTNLRYCLFECWDNVNFKKNPNFWNHLVMKVTYAIKPYGGTFFEYNAILPLMRSISDKEFDTTGTLRYDFDSPFYKIRRSDRPVIGNKMNCGCSLWNCRCKFVIIRLEKIARKPLQDILTDNFVEDNFVEDNSVLDNSVLDNI